ncbi:hypothetical protein K0504_15975 [Neiella marina]|uniref:Thiamin/hydroxymethyl pyrimidine-binding YkoF putative domain-containing protein n=1 Tax=Neiella holothuriorum TaxID=2870530 RepID=A0ABS7EJK8_9GAMM|nr:hypothetical protein [Neiella holothuriorum]MBW8192538.1 hypothetical protein [Neiella holothuriorum]
MLTVDISMYPLKDDYLTPISWFIERLASYPNIKRTTNALATQICGPHDDVMAMLSTEMKAAHEAFGQAVFVCKFLPGERELDYQDNFGKSDR